MKSLSSETRILALFNGWLIGPDNDPLDDCPLVYIKEVGYPWREKSDDSHARSVHSNGFIGKPQDYGA